MGNLKYGKYDAETAAEEKEESESTGGAEMFKLAVGRNVLRILPPPVGSKSPFKTVYQHFVELPGNRKSFICARLEAKKPCVICKKIEELKASTSKADREAADDLYARRRIFVNVIDRKNPEKGPMVMAIGKQVHEQLLALRDEETGGDYCDPEEGFDVIIERTGTGKNDTKYKVFLTRKSSPLAGSKDDPDYDKMQEWIDTQNDLQKFARLPDQQEVAGLLDGGGDEEEEEAPPKKPVKRLTSRASSGSSTSSKKSKRSAEDDAIDVEGEEVEE